MDIYEMEIKLYENNSDNYDVFVDDKESEYDGFAVHGAVILLNSNKVLLNDGKNNKWIEGSKLNYRADAI